MAKSLESMYKQSFEDAQAYGLSPMMYYYSKPDEYSFGHDAPVGVELVDLAPGTSQEPTILLDVGAGKGDFLAGAKTAHGDRVAAIGLTAVAHKEQVEADIDWVYGDLLRPQTWRPAGVLVDGTVDVSVSRLTYHWLANPISALETNYGLLKPDGHLFVDVIHAHLDSDTSDTAAGMITEAIDARAGEYNVGNYDLNELYDGSHMLSIKNLHMRGGKPIDFGRIALSSEKLLVVE